MILTVTPNPALDLTYRIDRFVPEASIRVPVAAVRAGGKGINVARVLRQTGAEAFVLATAGGSVGAQLGADLRASELPHRLVPVAGETRRSVAIVEAGRGTTTVLNEVGAGLSDAEGASLMSAVRDALDAPAPPACVVASGSLPPGLAPGFYAEVVRCAQQRRIPVIADATGPALLEAARAGADLLKPNRDELRESVGEADPVRGARALIAAGARRVLVSLGHEGMVLLDGAHAGRPVHGRFALVLTGNPTGAGDAAVAASASLLAAGSSDPELILRRAIGWSAASVRCSAAGELPEDYASFEQGVVIGDDRPGLTRNGL